MHRLRVENRIKKGNVKMKIKNAIKVILGFLLGAASAVATYFATEGDVAWQVYLEEELIPNAVLAISTVGGLCAAAIPIINRVVATLGKFDRATADIKETTENDRALAASVEEYKAELTASVEEYKSELIGAIEDMQKMRDEISETVTPLETRLANIGKMLHIAFCNSDELVKKGYAREIAKLDERCGACNDTVPCEEHAAAEEKTEEGDINEQGKEETEP